MSYLVGMTMWCHRTQMYFTFSTLDTPNLLAPPLKMKTSPNAPFDSYRSFLVPAPISSC